MRFSNGMFGACICVLALLGTAIGGFVLNVHEDQRGVTNYNYVADVSGLFTYSDAPDYIEYNPSTNYVGYTPGAVEYTQSSSANNYRYLSASGTTTTNSLTITDSSVYPDDYYSDHILYALWNGSIDFGDVDDYWGGFAYNVAIGNTNSTIMTKLSNVLSALAGGNLTAYQSIEVTITQNETYPVMFYAGNWNTIESHGETILYSVLNENNTMPDRLVYNSTSNQVDAYRNGNLIWSSFSDNVGVLPGYGINEYGYLNTVDTSATLSATLTGFPTYAYMQPSAGVKATSTEATWQNGYDNSVIDLKVVRNGDYPNSAQFLIITAGGFELTIYKNTGDNALYIRFDDGLVRIKEMGAWLGLQIRIDALNGDVIVTPTNDVDLTTTVEPTDYSIVISDVITPGTLSSFNVKALASNVPSLKFQVTNTKVFLNTYNTVMIDPSIEITDYFPNYSDYRLNFYSFALLGSSMSINGQNCPINKDNGTITFTNVAGFEFTKKLENLYITFNEGRTYLTFVNDGTTYDLGETTTTTISFVGWWYFTTGLYEITEGMETFWNWDLSGFQATGGECLLIFLTIIGAGIIVYSVYGKGKIQLFDWLVIIFAVFIGSALLGF